MGKKSGWYGYFSWSLLDQSTENNTSKIRLTLYVHDDTGASWNQDGDSYTNINGTRVWTGSYSFSSAGNYNMGSLDLTVSHNSDGSFGSHTYSGTWVSNNETSYTPASVSASITLSSSNIATIPRASDISIDKSSLNINTSGSTSQAATISISKKSASFTHKIYYSFGGGSGLTAGLSTTSPSTSCTFTPPLDLAKQIPTSLSGTCTLTLETYSGSTKVGSKTTSLSLNIDTSAAEFKVNGTIGLSENNSVVSNSA